MSFFSRLFKRSTSARPSKSVVFPADKSYMGFFLFHVHGSNVNWDKAGRYSETAVLNAARTSLEAPAGSGTGASVGPLFIASNHLDIYTELKRWGSTLERLNTGPEGRKALEVSRTWESLLSDGAPQLEKVLDISLSALKDISSDVKWLVYLLPLERSRLEAMHRSLSSNNKPRYVGALILKTSAGAFTSIASQLGIDSLTRAVSLETPATSKQPEPATGEGKPDGETRFLLNCLSCGRELDSVLASGAAMEGGARRCAACSEEHLYAISEGRLVLRRVSLPVGYNGASEVTVLPSHGE